jgi:hypothetical protein
VIPLLSSDPAEPHCVTLEETLDHGQVKITEVSQGGSVQSLKMIDKSASKLLVVDEKERVIAHARLGWPFVQRRLGKFQPADSVCRSRGDGQVLPADGTHGSLLALREL